jgi:hypothetical protein
MTSVRLLASLTFLLATGRAEAQPPTEPSGWRLVYAVDSLGNRTQGDKPALLAAVRAGLPVRVGFGIAWKLRDGTAGGVEHVADAAFLTIHHEEVFAQLRPILGQAPAAREPDIALRAQGDRLWYALLDTTGRLQGYFTGDSTSRTTRVATFWYVAGQGGAGPSRLY